MPIARGELSGRCLGSGGRPSGNLACRILWQPKQQATQGHSVTGATPIPSAHFPRRRLSQLAPDLPDQIRVKGLNAMSHNKNHNIRRTASGIARRSALTAGMAACLVGATLAVGIQAANAGPSTPIVVLGAGVTDQGGPGNVNRLQAGLGRIQASAAPVIVSGGRTNAKLNVTEARAMRNWLQAHGVDGRRIIEEPTAGNTARNAGETARILRDSRWAPEVVLVTSGCHMGRAVTEFAAAGVRVVEKVNAPGGPC
ncbi:YdcF family protein [Nocardia colli]|uniref:YdcF family protein n=1 Tax=Nocardia colli TaxID=2545717 RepID=A0A5N0EJK7_9NOCA|nr:YdcF family protein [Nocardia colli]